QLVVVGAAFFAPSAKNAAQKKLGYLAAAGLISAIAAASPSRAAEPRRPSTRPPDVSASRPVSVGPSSCPSANSAVAFPMIVVQRSAGRLRRTCKVIAVTIARNELPNSTAESAK